MGNNRADTLSKATTVRLRQYKESALLWKAGLRFNCSHWTPDYFSLILIFLCNKQWKTRRCEQCNQRNLEGKNFEREGFVDKDNLFRSLKLPPSSLDMTEPQYFRVFCFVFFSSPPPSPNIRQGTPSIHVLKMEISLWDQLSLFCCLSWPLDLTCPALVYPTSLPFTTLAGGKHCCNYHKRRECCSVLISIFICTPQFQKLNFADKVWIYFLFLFTYQPQSALLLGKPEISICLCSGFFVN